MASQMVAGESLSIAENVAVYRTGEKVRVTAELPEKPEGRESELSWKLRDWNQVECQKGSVKLAMSSLSAATVAFKPLPPGWYEAEFTCEGRAIGKRTFVTGDYYKSKGEQFRYGACAHLASNEGKDLQKLLDLQKWLGLDIERNELIWAFVQKGVGKRFNFERFDLAAKYLAENDIEMAPLLDYSPSWASNAPEGTLNTESWRYSPKIDPWLDYVRACVNHFGKKVKYWEIWNEEDIGGFWKSPVEEYVTLFNKTSAEICKINPDARVMNGGFAMVPREPTRDFVPRFLGSADRSHWNTLSYHDYITFAETLIRFQETQQFMKKANVSLPMWINEGGFHTLMPGGERAQAITLVKKLTTAAGLGVKAYFWYDVRDDRNSETDGEHHFGLVRRDFQPKPAFAAYRQLIYRVADRPMLASRLGDGENLFVISYGARRQISTAQSVHVVWKETPGPDEPMWLGSDSPKAILRVFDLMGQSTQGEITNGGGLVIVGNNPMYVEASEGNKLEVRRILKLPERIMVLPQGPQTVSVGITSPFQQRAKISATLECRAGQKLVPIASAWSAQFAPGEAKTASFQLEAATVKDLLKSGVDHAELSFLFADGKQPQVIRLLLDGPQVIGNAANPWHMVIGARDHIVNLHEGEPDPAMHWSGSDDLSAEASATWQPDGLKLVVDAKDDVQSQKYDSASLWKGDSLQVAAATLENPSDWLEVSLALLKSGQSDSWINRAPKASSITAGPLPAEMKVQVVRKDKTTRYELLIPWKAMGFSDAPDKPFLFNFLVNDDDGTGRKQWLQFTPGIGKEKETRLFKTFILRK